jgi:hypothetical protein
VLVQVIEDNVADLAALQVDDDAEAVAIGFVADVGDAFDSLGVDQFGDVLDQALLVDLIRNRRDDDRRAVAFLRDFDFGLRTHDHGATPGQIGLLNAVPPDDVTTSREVGPWH